MVGLKELDVFIYTSMECSKRNRCIFLEQPILNKIDFHRFFHICKIQTTQIQTKRQWQTFLDCSSDMFTNVQVDDITT